MLRIMIWLLIGMLAGTMVACAQETSAPAEAPLAPPPPVMGDMAALWSPSAPQVASWISQGFAAAGAETDLLMLPVVELMTWSSAGGSALPGNRTLRFTGLMTPELVSQLVGYSSAWEEETWEAIQGDPEAVAADLAAILRPSLMNGSLYLPLAISGPAYAGVQAALYYDGQWRTLPVRPWKGMTELTAEEQLATMTEPLWAMTYLLASGAELAPFQPKDQVRLYLCTWERGNQSPVAADFLVELPAPEWSGTKQARLAVGDADLFAWVDFELP